MFHSYFLVLLLLLSLFCMRSSASCPRAAVCVYVAPPDYSDPNTNTSQPIGAPNNPFVSLSQAILAADPSPSATTYLVMYTGTYSGADNNNLNTAGKNLVLISNDYFSNSMPLADAAINTTIDGGMTYGEGGTRCLTVSPGKSSRTPIVSIIAITIQNCMGSYGPAISVSGATLNLNGVSLLTNFATASGGALFATSATINMNNSAIERNLAQAKGGGVYLLGCITTISNSVLLGSQADTTGGAGYVEGGSLTVTHSTISQNVAAFAGGFSLADAQAIVSDCQFIDNYAGGGNALDLDSSNLNCTNTIFSGPPGTQTNGLVHIINYVLPVVDNYIINCSFLHTHGLRFSSISIENTNGNPAVLSPVTHIINSNFIGNYASGDAGATGGALHGNNAKYTCSGCRFKGNYGAQLGAAAVCENEASCKFENCIFEENYSWRGAAVYIDASNDGLGLSPTNAQIINCTFLSNALMPSFPGKFPGKFPGIAPVGYSFMGGAIFVGAQSLLSVVGGTMVNNSAQYGGAIYIDTNDGKNIQLSNIVLRNNHATMHGGAIYMANFLSLTNVSVQTNIASLSFVNNVAVNGCGGGIYVAQGIANYNPALYGAAALRNESQVCAFCKYAGNTAQYGKNLATDPFQLNVQMSSQPMTANMISGDTSVNGILSINSASTIYVSAVLVDFFDQQVSAVSGVEVDVSAKNGIISNLVMTGDNADSSVSNNVSSTNANILMLNGAATFSLSLLSYPGSQATVSVSVPRVTGLATASMPLEINVCTDDEFVSQVSQIQNLAICSSIAIMPSGGKVAALAVTAVSYLVLALFFLFFIIWRNHKVVYQSSIVFCMLIMLGLALVNSAAVLSALDKTVTICTARIFLLHAGFAFAIGSVSVKLFRLQLIFNNPLLVMLKLSDAVMLWRLLVVLLLNVTPVVVWTIVDPFQSSGLNEDGCTSSNSLAYELTLLCFNGLLLLSSAYFAFCLRNTPSQYNETTALAVLNYVVLVLGIVWILLRWIGNLSATSLSLAEAFLLTCGTLLTSCILFGPKVYVILRALISKAVRLSSQKLPNGAKRTSCCCLLISGMSNRHTGGKKISERFDLDHSMTATPANAATPRGVSRNQVMHGNELDFDELDENVKNNPNELNTFLLDKIGSLKERLQSRVGALKHSARQWAAAEKDVREIITLLGSACSEYQFLHSRGNRAIGSGKDPMELVNDPLFTDAANAIGRSYAFMSDSGGTGNGSSQRYDRKASNKSPPPSRRMEAQIFAGVTPTNAESKFETPTGRTAPLSGRSAVGKQGSSTSSSAAIVLSATVTSPTLPSKQSLPVSHDSVVEHGTFGRMPERLSVALIDAATINHADTHRNSARGSRSSGTNGNNNGNGSAHEHIEMEGLTVHR